MKGIFDMLDEDRRLMLDTNFYQELCCQLHMRGVYTVNIYSKPPNTDCLRTMLFRTWNIVPPTVCLLLVIPRAKFNVLETGPEGTPTVQCNFQTPSVHNIFSSIQLVFGSVTTSGNESEARTIVNEDPSRWSGLSDLVMSGPPTAAAYANKLGMTLSLFTANLTDRKSVYVLPVFSSKNTLPNVSSPISEHQEVSVSLWDTKVSTLAAKRVISDVAPQDVQGTVQTALASPCVMEVKLRSISYTHSLSMARNQSCVLRASPAGLRFVLIPYEDLDTR